MAYEDARELAAHLTGKDEEDMEAIEEGLREKWGVDFDNFQEIANALLPLTMPFPSPFGGHLHGFVIPDASKAGIWHGLMRTRANVEQLEATVQVAWPDEN